MTTITSISIPHEQVRRLIEDWLNANVLREPQSVTSFDVDDDFDLVSVAFDDPPRARPPVTVSPCHPVTPALQEEPPASPPGPKRESRRGVPLGKWIPESKVSPELRAEILRLKGDGVRVREISERTRVAPTSVHAFVAAARRAAE
jgi:hypothetical protein